MSSLIEFVRGRGHRFATRRAPLVAIVVAGSWLCLGASSALADTFIDTSGCAADGAGELSAPPNSQNDWGAEFVAPTGYIKSFAPDLASDGNQAVTLALYNGNSSGPVGLPVWSAPATVDSTGSSSTFALQTFTVDQPVTPGNTYVFALLSGTPTATAWWAVDGASSGPCYPGPVVSGYAQPQTWFPPLTYESFVYKADFGTPAPPTSTPTTVSFPAQLEGTIGSVQTVTISSSGDVPVTLGQLALTGADAGDFILAADQCSDQSLAAAQSCTVGIRFAPQATGGATRTATLNVPYGDGLVPPTGAGNPPLGTVTTALSGTAMPMPTPPVTVPGTTPGSGAGGTTGTGVTTGAGGTPGTTGGSRKVELVTCKLLTRTVTVHGHTRRVTTEQCTAKLVSTPVVFGSGSNVAATLSRGGAVYASGRGTSTRVELTVTRTLKRGTYVLTERRGRTTTHLQVTIA